MRLRQPLLNQGWREVIDLLIDRVQAHGHFHQLPCL